MRWFIRSRIGQEELLVLTAGAGNVLRIAPALTVPGLSEDSTFQILSGCLVMNRCLPSSLPEFMDFMLFGKILWAHWRSEPHGFGGAALPRLRSVAEVTSADVDEALSKLEKALDSVFAEA